MPWGFVAGAVITGVSSASSSSKASKSADRATDAQAALGYEQLELSREEFAANKDRAARTDAIAERVANAQIDTMGKQQGLADEYADYNRTTFRPLEKGLVSEAQNYDTPAEQAKAAGVASADVAKAFAANRATTSRDLARMGVNPNSGRALAVRDGLTIQAALAESGAENNARDKVKQLGWAKRMDVTSLGRNLPSAQATAAQTGVAAGNSAVNSTVAANQSYQSGLQAPGALMAGAGISLNGAANNYMSIQNATNQQNAGMWGGVGSAAGMALRYGAPANAPINGVAQQPGVTNWVSQG